MYVCMQKHHFYMFKYIQFNLKLLDGSFQVKMMTISKYFCHPQRSTMFRYVKKGYASVSNNCYKHFQAHKNTCESRTKDSNNSMDQIIESCYLTNGMRLVCEYRNSFTTTLGCFLPAGAMHETPTERGSAIFLEHLLFRRTQCNNQEQLEKLFEEIGGRVTAVAMRDKFLFYATVPSCQVDKLVELFANVILNGTICDEDVEREKCVILYELSKVELDSIKVAMDYLPTFAYQDTALANSVYPETSVIKKFCSEELIEFRSRLFKTCYMTMVCTGSIYLSELQSSVCKYFNAYRDDDKTSNSCKKPSQYRFSGGELRLRDDDYKLGYVAIGIEGPSYEQREDHFVLTAAKELIGAWDETCGGANHNAPYMAHFAFNTNICHMYKSFFQNWEQTTSIWGCYFVCHRLTLEPMSEMLQKEWIKLCTTVTQKELCRAIQQCQMNEMMLLSDPVSRFFDIVTHLYRYGCYEPIRRRVSEYEKITLDKMREVCDKYIYDQSPVVIAIGRVENLPSYYFLRNRMYSLRY